MKKLLDRFGFIERVLFVLRISHQNQLRFLLGLLWTADEITFNWLILEGH